MNNIISQNMERPGGCHKRSHTGGLVIVRFCPAAHGLRQGSYERLILFSEDVPDV